MLTRHQVIRFPCPTCLVRSGERCRRTTDDPEGGGTRASFHQDRRTYARLRHRETALEKELAEVQEALKGLAPQRLKEILGLDPEETPPEPASQPHFTNRGLK